MKKSICLLMCAAVICSMFTACASDKDADTGEEDASIIEDLQITVDYHYSDMDESVIRVYNKLCQAVMNYDSEVKFNTSMTDDLNQLFYTSFPLYSLVDGLEFLDDDSGVSISYKNEQEEHLQKVEEFTNAVGTIMGECGYGSVSDNEYLLNLYTYITTNVTVDNSVTTVMDTIVDKKGVSATISGMFEYLLLQAGISASHILNKNSDSIATMLSMAEFNGSFYYFDPTSELAQNSGEGLAYFAMDSSRALSSESDNFVFTDDTEADEITDDTYSSLISCTSYTVEDSTVTAKCKGNADFVFTLD